ncbi:protein of unknown function (plasmid) [Cupriavidus taiwanensis]|uniref:Uncharacterized protein n=1 Tax=Cupriavidus taiwanensis TaxID=164546 RepID=A0A375IKW2_9BURK|nr:hypothetical protein CBM2608_B100106 [Cupriavidus taiwanensis]SPK74740.1 protein of unknown function [Cupriavidus taiwanensis]
MHGLAKAASGAYAALEFLAKKS